MNPFGNNDVGSLFHFVVRITKKEPKLFSLPTIKGLNVPDFLVLVSELEHCSTLVVEISTIMVTTQAGSVETDTLTSVKKYMF